MKFLIFVFLLIAILNVKALSKKRLSISEDDRHTSFLERAAAANMAGPPPNSGFKTSLLEGETSTFELLNFYEYSFYVQSYILYNAYSLNTGLTCSSQKKQFWYEKKMDALALYNFCKLIGNQINSSYLNTSLCSYIYGTVTWFNYCSY